MSTGAALVYYMAHNRSDDVYLQIYDIVKFMSLVAEQFRNLPINVQKIQMLSMVNFSFVYDAESENNTPCWVNIINLCALDLLSNKQG